MKFGLWPPVRHAIRTEDRMTRALASHEDNSEIEWDDVFDFALEVIRQAEISPFSHEATAPLWKAFADSRNGDSTPR